MTKPVVVLRNVKGSHLTFTELDTNFTNLRDATINLTDGTNTLTWDLNDTKTIEGVANHNMAVTVDNTTGKITIDNKLGDYTFEPMGFENRTDSTISFSAGSRQFTIAPTSTSYRIWVKGKMFTKTASASTTIPNSSELYYFYFDDTGALQNGTSFSFGQHCPIAAVQWNANTGNYYFLGEERHGISMDWATHQYLNETRGMQYASGFSATNYTTTGSGSLDADAQLDLTDGVVYQEDIRISVSHSNSPTYSLFQQDIAGPGRFPVTYHSGSTGEWVKDSATNFPVKAGTSRITYNLNTAGTWTTTDASNGHFVAYWLVATSNILDGPIVAVMGQREDANIGNAQDNNTFSELDLTNFPGAESRPLYRLIFQTGSYGNTVNARLVDIQDIRLETVRATLGSTASGLANVIEDTNPQLGGNLDVNNFDIVNNQSNGPIYITPNGTGVIMLNETGTGQTIARITQASGTSRSPLVIQRNYTGGAIGTMDGHSTGILFSQRDDTSTIYTYARISAEYSTGGDHALWFEKTTDGTTFTRQATVTDNNLILGATSGTTAQKLTTYGSQNLVLSTDFTGGTSSSITIAASANGNIDLAPNGSGKIILDGLSWPTADGSPNYVLKTDGAGNLSWVAQSGGGLNNVVEDTTPQLGGNLDVQSYSITSSVGAITLSPNGTSDVILDTEGLAIGDGTGVPAIYSYNVSSPGLVIRTESTYQGSISFTGGQNGDISIEPHGTGNINLRADQVCIGDVNANAVLTTSGTGDLILSTVNNTTTGSIRIYNGANGNIELAPNGTGKIVLDGLNWPTSDGTSNQYLKTDGAGNLSWGSGGSGLTDIVNDTTPQLGGALDVQSYKINTSVTNGNITLQPDGTGKLIVTNGKITANDNTTVNLTSKNGVLTEANLDVSPTSITLTPDATGSIIFAGAINVQSNAIATTSTNANITLTPNGTGYAYLNGPIKTNTTSGTPTTYENGYYEDMLMTPVSWLKVNIGGSDYYLPLYQ